MASLSQNCPACGFPNHPDNPLCSNCGRSVTNRPQNAALRPPNNRTPANNRNIPNQFAGTQATNKIFGVHYGLVIAAGVVLSVFLMGIVGALNPKKTEPTNSRSLYSSSNTGSNSSTTSVSANYNSYSSGSNTLAVSNKPVNSDASGASNFDAAAAGLIIGNRQSKTYYRQSCFGYNDISAENRVVFKTVRKAAAAGYRGAEGCEDSQANGSTPAPSTGSAIVSRRESSPALKAVKSAPGGASARCRDGSLSFSQSRRGTCSHHGGVAEWF